MFKKLLFTLCFAFGLGMLAHAQNWQTGMVVKDQQNGYVTFEVRLSQIDSEILADGLERALVDKEGIVSAETDVENRLLTVLAKPEINARLLEEIVLQSGFEVAKNFHP